MRLAFSLAAAALLATPAAAQDYVLQLEYETETRGDDGEVTSSASGRQPIAEKVIAATPEGTELEYSLPFDPEEIRGNERWMFPARVRVAPDGGKTILNPDELLARNAAWLAEAEWPREVCSRSGFSWTAYQVRCDVEAAIARPFPFGDDGNVVITAVIGIDDPVEDEIQNKIAWQRCMRPGTYASRIGRQWTGSVDIADGPGVVLPGGLELGQNQMVIVAEVFYPYRPVIAQSIVAGILPEDNLFTEIPTFRTRGQAIMNVTPVSGVTTHSC